MTRVYAVRLMRSGQDQHPGRRPLIVADFRRPELAAAELDRLMETMAEDLGAQLDAGYYLELVDEQDPGHVRHWYHQEG